MLIFWPYGIESIMNGIHTLNFNSLGIRNTHTYGDTKYTHLMRIHNIHTHTLDGDMEDKHT